MTYSILLVHVLHIIKVHIPLEKKNTLSHGLIYPPVPTFMLLGVELPSIHLSRYTFRRRKKTSRATGQEVKRVGRCVAGADGLTERKLDASLVLVCYM